MAAAQTKISVHSLADLKNTSDDAIPNYLNSLKFTQSHTLSDIRLALGYTAFFISAACFYWDYKLGWDSTKYYTAAAVALYACINGLLTFWIWGVEKGKVYVGTSPAGDKIEISSSTKKHVPIYDLTITYYIAANPRVPNTLKLSRPFTQWFDAAGHFVPLHFQQMFAGEVPMIGKADPTNAVVAGKKVVQTTFGGGSDLHQAVDSIMGASSTASGGTATPRKGAKNRKKA